MKRLPTTRQLQYFEALTEHQHFGRAAEACFVSQSAFSIAIRELEALLGCALFERNNKSVAITAAGKDLALRNTAILRAVEDMLLAAQQHLDPLCGDIRLGVIPTIAPFLLPKLVPALKKRLPDCHLILHEAQSADVHQQLLKGDLDVILLALPFELPGTEQRALFKDRFHLAMAKRSRWVSAELLMGDTVTGDLPEEAVILLEDGHCLRDHALSECKLQGKRRGKQLSTYASTSISTLLPMVAQDLGVTFLPEMALGSALLKGSGLQTHPMPSSSYRHIGIAWREGSPFTEAFTTLGKEIERIAKPT